MQQTREAPLQARRHGGTHLNHRALPAQGQQAEGGQTPQNQPLQGGSGPQQTRGLGGVFNGVHGLGDAGARTPRQQTALQQQQQRHHQDR